ncbi:hypothetical protein K0M31_002982 [Melipona bicolor]|uniref:Uncharacterized protein n=1 Tax=Melipona bicolor TaxID=60889 RepID=A0AA40G0M3_9HYME|nr:hypothetical protein K0M31_002982 [Melipona bicolor]
MSQVFAQATKVPRRKKKHLSSLLRSRNKGVQRGVEKSRKTMRECGQSSLSLERKNGLPRKTGTSLEEEFLWKIRYRPVHLVLESPTVGNKAENNPNYGQPCQSVVFGALSAW